MAENLFFYYTFVCDCGSSLIRHHSTWRYVGLDYIMVYRYLRGDPGSRARDVVATGGKRSCVYTADISQVLDHPFNPLLHGLAIFSYALSEFGSMLLWTCDLYCQKWVVMGFYLAFGSR